MQKSSEGYYTKIVSVVAEIKFTTNFFLQCNK